MRAELTIIVPGNDVENAQAAGRRAAELLGPATFLTATASLFHDSVRVTYAIDDVGVYGQVDA